MNAKIALKRPIHTQKRPIHTQNSLLKHQRALFTPAQEWENRPLVAHEQVDPLHFSVRQLLRLLRLLIQYISVYYRLPNNPYTRLSKVLYNFFSPLDSFRIRETLETHI